MRKVRKWGKWILLIWKGKPAPDIFLIAASRFAMRPNPSDCLIFEDAPNGVISAVVAGKQCVMVQQKSIIADISFEFVV